MLFVISEQALPFCIFTLSTNLDVASSVIVRVILIKTTVTHPLIPVRVATIPKARSSQCWQGHGVKGTLVLLVGMYIGAATMENSIEIP